MTVASSPQRPMDARKTVYVAGDLSGIQAFVLGIKAGQDQAKRLRARSFQVELYERAALARVQDHLSVPVRDVLVQGGGGFLLRATGGSDTATDLDVLQRRLQRRLREETAGEILISLGWGTTAREARRQLEHRKRRPWSAVLQNGGAWDKSACHLSGISPPCQLCRRQRADSAPGEEQQRCPSCRQSSRLGDRLTTWAWMRRTSVPADGSTSALGVSFETVPSPTKSAFRVRRTIPRHANSGKPMTFEELAATATGASRLAVLKADVDDLGIRVESIAAEDPTYGALRDFSRHLHSFFSDSMQDMLAASWPNIYTLFAGGDDLLLIGPWNAVIDFAGALRAEFDAGPATAYPGLTLSAGIALTPFRMPVRHAVERAEVLLDAAKSVPAKNRCSCLGATWQWERHDVVVSDGRLLATAIRERKVSRSLLQRLLTLLESASGLEMSEARWHYQTERSVPRLMGPLHKWAQRVLETLGDPARSQELGESAASIRYALLKSREE